jgi:hypothetical protein
MRVTAIIAAVTLEIPDVESEVHRAESFPRDGDPSKRREGSILERGQEVSNGRAKAVFTRNYGMVETALRLQPAYNVKSQVNATTKNSLF